MQTPVTELLGIEFPILAFSHCRDVVAAVTNAGGMGVLGGVAHTPEQLDIDLTWIEEQTKGRPYGVDLLLPQKYTGSDTGGLDRGTLSSLLPPEQLQFLDEMLERYGVPPLAEEDRVQGGRGGMQVDPRGYEPLLDVTFAHRIGLFASALGAPPAPVVERCKGAGVPVAALAGAVAHAARHKAAGVDLIVAQGTEAGGHTGEVATMVLVPEVVDAVAPLPGAGRRRHRPGTPGGRSAGARRRRRLVRVGVAHHRGGRDAPRGEAEVPRCRFQRHAAVPLAHRQARPHAAHRMDRRVGAVGHPGPAAHAAAEHAGGRCAAAHRPVLCPAGSGAEQLAVYFVGQVVGTMNQIRPAKHVVLDMIDEFIDTVQRLDGLLAD
jgi:hypothetical protein